MKKMFLKLKSLAKLVYPMPCKGVKREFNAVMAELSRMKRSQREAFRDEAGLICNALEKTYAAIEAKNSLMAQKIEALNSELKAARSEIAALKPELEAVKRDIGKTGGGLESCLAAVGDGVKALGPRLDFVSGKVDGIAMFGREIEAVRRDVGKVGDGLDASLAAVGDGVRALGPRLDFVSGKVDGIATLGREIEAVRRDVGKVGDGLDASLAAVGDGVRALGPRLDFVSGKVDGIATLGREIEAVRRDVGKVGDGLEARIAAIGDGVSAVGPRLDSVSEKVDGIVALSPQIEKALPSVVECNKHAREAFWAEVFNSSIADCKWLKGVSFSPSGWAAGYQFLYLLYRALLDKRPQCILDIGLGQTSKLVARYAAANPAVRHVVVEESSSWIEFFGRNNRLPKNTEIIRLDYEMTEFPGCTAPVRTYHGFKEALAGRKFDLVLIDAPYSGDMREIARVDILDMIPESIASSYVMLIDDTNRKGERRLVEELVLKLQQNGLSASTAKYRGRNECNVVVSDDNAYFKTI